MKYSYKARARLFFSALLLLASCLVARAIDDNDRSKKVKGYPEIINDDGLLDKTFGNLGMTLTGLGENFSVGAQCLAVQADGKLVVAGYVNGGNAVLLVSRYTKEGNIDTSFGGGKGTILTPVGDGSLCSGNAIAVQKDGKIVVTGTTRITKANHFTRRLFVVRYTALGAMDTDFGDNGLVLVGGICCGNAIAVQADGKIVVVGSTYGIICKMAIARFTESGKLDASFGLNGVTITSVGEESWQKFSGIALQPDGKIVAVGNLGYRLIVARYTTDGIVDKSFGTDGLTITLIGKNTNGRGVALQSDGSIIVVGDATLANLESFVARYNTLGKLDESFGYHGSRVISLGKITIGRGVVLQADGKIVVVGDVSDGTTTTKLALTRYLSSGWHDLNFGNYGSNLTSFGKDTNIYGHAIASQSDGKIVVAGNGLGKLFVARYHTENEAIVDAY